MLEFIITQMYNIIMKNWTRKIPTECAQLVYLTSYNECIVVR